MTKINHQHSESLDHAWRLVNDLNNFWCNWSDISLSLSKKNCFLSEKCLHRRCNMKLKMTQKVQKGNIMGRIKFTNSQLFCSCCFNYSFPSCHSVIVITTPKTPIITYFLRVLLSYDINFLIWHWLKHFEWHNCSLNDIISV